MRRKKTREVRKEGRGGGGGTRVEVQIAFVTVRFDETGEEEAVEAHHVAAALDDDSDASIEHLRFLFDAYTVCLLYTSPSPRDRG